MGTAVGFAIEFAQWWPFGSILCQVKGPDCRMGLLGGPLKNNVNRWVSLYGGGTDVPAKKLSEC